VLWSYYILICCYCIWWTLVLLLLAPRFSMKCCRLLIAWELFPFCGWFKFSDWKKLFESYCWFIFMSHPGSFFLSTLFCEAILFRFCDCWCSFAFSIFSLFLFGSASSFLVISSDYSFAPNCYGFCSIPDILTIDESLPPSFFLSLSSLRFFSFSMNFSWDWYKSDLFVTDLLFLVCVMVFPVE